jgi:DNA-directed RNA polymerase subunit M/transcription elongation factor TFIIS
MTIPVQMSSDLLAEINQPVATTPFFRSPQYVGVDCHVCQTRLYGTPDQIGQSLKCPDCGKLTVLTRPVDASGSKTPKAMEGEQYELMEDEPPPKLGDTTLPSTQFIAVHCKVCDTLMQARVDQVGQKLTCPDCGKQTVVPPPPPPRKVVSVLTEDGDDYEVEVAADPGLPAVTIPHRNRMQFEEADAAAAADMSPAAVRRRRKLDARGRPKLPRMPLVTGILPFLFSRGVPGWWVLLTLGYAVCGFLILDAAQFAAAGGRATFAALISFLLGAIPGVVLVAVTATVWVTVIAESSDGHDEIQNWNTGSFLEWFGYLPYLVAAASASAVPGALASSLVTNDQWIRAAVGLTSTIAALPIVTLSQLDNDTPWGILSGRILATLGRCPGSWLLFYIETGVMLGSCFSMTVACANANISPLVLTPVYVATFLLYARLLGRLGWKLAEATAA